MQPHHRRLAVRVAHRWSPIALALALVCAPLVGEAPARAESFLKVVATSPGNRAIGAAGSPTILVRFNDTIAPTSPLPTISPAIAGNWKRVDRQLIFTPSGAFAPDNPVTVTVHGGATGVTGADGLTMRSDRSFTFGVGDGSLLRAQQLLAELNYLPVTWHHAGSTTSGLGAYELAAFTPPRGRFTFIGQEPRQLRVLWKPGVATRVWTSALATYESDHDLPPDGLLSGPVWESLLTEARHPGAHRSRAGYTFAVANQRSPETLTIWRGGTVVLNTLANTGVSLAPTADGLFAVYAKLRTQIMKGTDPFGKKYADPVSWISYFNGSDAVHYFDRGGYGYAQSLGCVEVPLIPAEKSYGFLKIGTLISVIN